MGKKNKSPAPITSKQTVSEAFAAILRHNLDAAVQWERTARSWEDIEGVHQMRVSFRRSRSALAAFRSAVPRKLSSVWEDEIRWIGNQLGLSRDLDVFIDEGLGVVRDRLSLAGGEQLKSLALKHRDLSYRTVRDMLDSSRYVRFKQEYTAWLDAKAWEQGALKPKHKKRLASTLVPFARLLLDQLERKVLDTGVHVNRESAGDMHRLRIQCKKLRYGAEFFLPLFKGMDEYIGHMKGLQDLLGVMNDVSVMRHLLDQILEGESDPLVLGYAGGLVGWRACQYEHILDSFDLRWDEFVHAKHPWWSKENTANDIYLS